MNNSLLDAVKTVLILLLRSVDVAEHCPLSEALLFLVVLSAHTVLLFLGPSFSQCPLQASFNVAIPQLLSSASISSTHMSFLQGLSPTSMDQITICCSDSQTSSLDLFPSLQSTTFTCLLECLTINIPRNEHYFLLQNFQTTCVSHLLKQSHYLSQELESNSFPLCPISSLSVSVS